MKKIDINQKWKMKIASEDTYYDAKVPGSVYNDLLDVGEIEDPYFRDNEGKALELMKNDFEYRGTFDIDGQETGDADEVLLSFSGIDTLADISLNGINLGSANNMHRIWEYPVRSILKEKDNEIVVKLHSPVNFIAKEFEADPAILGTEDAMRGFPKIRKGHYMFGWDWGPRLPDAGIWKSVSLFKIKGARLTRTYISQKWNEDYSRVDISVSAMIETMEDGSLTK